MPLTRATVTAASRIMLPTYVALTTLIGLVYLLDPLNRISGVHALAVPKMLMPMQWWGLVFLTIAAVMCAAFLSHKRALFVVGLYLCAATFAMWAVMYGVSVKLDPETSVLAPVYPTFVVVCCRASAKSLLRGERD